MATTKKGFNAVQTKVVDFLKTNPGKAFTLAQIGEAIGEPNLKSGTVNPIFKDSTDFGHGADCTMYEMKRTKVVVKTYGYSVDSETASDLNGTERKSAE